MDWTTFEDLLDRHGGDLEHWPAAQHDAARALLTMSPRARAAMAAMAEVEAVLRRGPSLEVAGAIDAIVARATRHRQETRRSIVAARAGWGAAAAAVLVLGLLIGGLTPSPDTTSQDPVVAAAFDASGVADVE